MARGMAPPTENTERHPHAGISHADANPQRAAPAVNPTVMLIISVTRRRRGLYSPMSAVAFGMMQPSPIPLMKRQPSSWGIEVAQAVSNVMAAKDIVAAMSTGRRPIVVGRHAEGERADQDAEVAGAEDIAERGVRDVPLTDDGRRDIAERLHVEPVHDETQQTDCERGDLERSNWAGIDERGDVDLTGRSGPVHGRLLRRAVTARPKSSLRESETVSAWARAVRSAGRRF